jgi:regulatory protein
MRSPRAGLGVTPSLRERALRHLSLREHSRVELARKLSAHAESEQQLEQVLNALAADGWLSESRFARSLVHRRSSRYGLHRIEAELDTHGVTLGAHQELQAELHASEQDRAWAAWLRRFGSRPEADTERMRQWRFLMQRGFSADTIKAVLRRAREQTSQQSPDPSQSMPGRVLR